MYRVFGKHYKQAMDKYNSCTRIVCLTNFTQCYSMHQAVPVKFMARLHSVNSKTYVHYIHKFVQLTCILDPRQGPVLLHESNSPHDQFTIVICDSAAGGCMASRWCDWRWVWPLIMMRMASLKTVAWCCRDAMSTYRMPMCREACMCALPWQSLTKELDVFDVQQTSNYCSSGQDCNIHFDIRSSIWPQTMFSYTSILVCVHQTLVIWLVCFVPVLISSSYKFPLQMWDNKYGLRGSAQRQISGVQFEPVSSCTHWVPHCKVSILHVIWRPIVGVVHDELITTASQSAFEHWDPGVWCWQGSASQITSLQHLCKRFWSEGTWKSSNVSGPCTLVWSATYQYFIRHALLPGADSVIQTNNSTRLPVASSQKPGRHRQGNCLQLNGQTSISRTLQTHSSALEGRILRSRGAVQLWVVGIHCDAPARLDHR